MRVFLVSRTVHGTPCLSYHRAFTLVLSPGPMHLPCFASDASIQRVRSGFARSPAGPCRISTASAPWPDSTCSSGTTCAIREPLPTARVPLSNAWQNRNLHLISYNSPLSPSFWVPIAVFRTLLGNACGHPHVPLKRFDSFLDAFFDPQEGLMTPFASSRTT
jgi:hypothetical protein